jgi:hypothetical protein
MKLEVVLSADTAKFIAGMDQSERKTTSMGRSVAWLGDKTAIMAGKVRSAANSLLSLRTAVIGAVAGIAGTVVVGQLNRASDEIDKLGKMGKRLGIPIKELSAMRLAALDANIEIEQLAGFAGKAQKNIAEMVSKGIARLNLGTQVIRLTDLNGRVRTITELMPELAKGIDSASSAAEKIRLSEKIFGRGGGAAFLQLLTDGGDYIKNMGEQTERARKLGVLFTDDQVKRLTAYNDSITHLGQAWLGVKVKIVNEVAPVLTELLESSSERLAKMPALIRAAAGAAKATLFGGATEGAQSRQLVGDLRDKTAAALKTTAVEVGRVVGTAFIEAVTTGLTAAGPVIADVFRDNIGPVLNVIPGVNIAKSEKGKLAELLGAPVQVDDMRRRILDLQKDLEKLRDPDNTVFREQSPLGLEGTIEAEIKSIEDKIKTRLAISAADIAAQRQVVEQESINRAREISDAVVAGMQATSQAAETAQSSIRKAWGEFDTAADAVIKMYAATEPPETSNKRTLADYFKMGGDAVTGFMYQLKQAEGPTTKVLQKIKEKMLEAMEVAQELEERQLAASGDEIGAKRLKLIRGFVKEQQELVERFGALSDPLIEQMKKVQAAELQAFDLEPLDKMLEKIKGMVPDSGSGPVADLAAQMQMLRVGFIDGKVSSEELRAELDRLERRLRGIQEREKTYGQLLSETIQGFARSASDAFADMVVDGETSFNQLLKSWTKTLISMTAQKFLFQPLFDAFAGGASGLFKPGVSPSSGYYAQNGLVGSARGNAFSGGQITPFAKGGVVYKPAVFPMARGMGLMGEAGPEAIMPLTRIGGHLGVRSAGSSTTVQIIDQRSGGAPVEVRESTGPDGRKMVQAIVRDQVAKMATDGSLDRVLGPAYGARRTPVAR